MTDISAILKLADGLEWRPISEAPKDGTPIIVEGGTVEWRLPFTESTHNNGELRGWFSHSAQRFLQWQPTHFMPLPTGKAGEVIRVLVEGLEVYAKHRPWGVGAETLTRAAAIAKGSPRIEDSGRPIKVNEVNLIGER